MVSPVLSTVSNSRQSQMHKPYVVASLVNIFAPPRSTRSSVCADNFEMASLPSTSEEERKRLLSFVVCGGGPTGVETAAVRLRGPPTLVLLSHTITRRSSICAKKTLSTTWVLSCPFTNSVVKKSLSFRRYYGNRFPFMLFSPEDIS